MVSAHFLSRLVVRLPPASKLYELFGYSYFLHIKKKSLFFLSKKMRIVSVRQVLFIVHRMIETCFVTVCHVLVLVTSQSKKQTYQTRNPFTVWAEDVSGGKTPGGLIDLVTLL